MLIEFLFFYMQSASTSRMKLHADLFLVC